MPTIKYPKNPNIDTAFVEQDDGTQNRALMIAPQDISTLELPNNPNSTKGYITVDGKKQRVILTADITGGGGSSYTAGTGIDITSGTISVTAPTLQNAATMPSAITILGAPSTTSYYTGSINIGVGSDANSDSAVSVGYSAISGSNCVTIGHNASTSFAIGGNAIGNAASAAGYSVAIGRGAIATSNNTMQIALVNGATNSDRGTVKIANHNGNFEIMSADGTIPTARLTKVNSTITLTAAGWSSNSQTVNVTGMTATGVVMVSPDPTDQSAYTSAGIICSAQAANSLTFTCSTTPSADLSVNVVML